MDARDREQKMLDRCARVVKGRARVARTRAEASVFRFAAMSLESANPSGANSLWSASERYFTTHTQAPATLAELMGKGHILTINRLRDMLAVQLQREAL